MKRRLLPGIAAVLLTAGGAIWWGICQQGEDPTDATEPPVRQRPEPSSATARPQTSVDAALAATARDGVSGQAITDLAAALKALPPDEAVREIRQLLASGRDGETGDGFELDSSGNLGAAPTLRTMLLDLVAAIDPGAAAEISREILAAPTTADEWAVALRNLGRVDDSPETSAFLHEKTVELIRNPEWQAQPSVGYLNAFDVLVHTEATAEAPLLSDLIKNKDRKDLAHAAFLTLDRLVQRQPAEMLAQLGTDAALSASRPEMTAQQFARGDLRDESQREIVARWLLDPKRTTTELTAFADVFPNHNQFVSNNLLTRDTASAGADLAAHDREVLEIVTSWADDPDFKPLNEHLSVMISRLESFVNTSQTFSSAPNE